MSDTREIYENAEYWHSQCEDLQAQVEELNQTVDQEINARLEALSQVERLKTELLIVTGYADQYLSHGNLTDMYDELEKAKAEGEK